MTARILFAAASIAVALGGWTGAASAHGRGSYYGPPPVVVVPRDYPYWYYSRPPRRHGPPAYYVVPAPRYYALPHYRHSPRRPDFSFNFRF